MLYPQSNPFRQVRDISGFWDFRFDPQNVGLRDKWFEGISHGRPIAVPASWNDQMEEGKDYLGVAWYQTRFDLPADFAGQKIFIRFESVNYRAEVWLNGEKLGRHEGGHLPFEFEITSRIQSRSNLLILQVEGEMDPERVPPGKVPPNRKDSFANSFYPQASFDFYPYCGIQRPVLLYAVPSTLIQDVTVVPSIRDSQGLLRVRVEISKNPSDRLRVSLAGMGQRIQKEISHPPVNASLTLEIPHARFWSPGDPFLYHLQVELLKNGLAVDQIDLPVGIRTIEIKKGKLLFNGKPVRLKGFGRHEDFPVVGRGYLPALIIKDYDLMCWIGANSFRTSHYPYSQQMMDLADRLGFLVIDETPAVGLFFQKKGLAKRFELCCQYTRDLIDRDKNHPSVIAWSLVNEPHSHRPAAVGFLKKLLQLAKKLDSTRPVTLSSYIGLKEEVLHHCDFIGLNRYCGWYSESGRLREGFQRLSADLDAIYKKFKKPILLTEFGADAIAGTHANPPEMYSEEYQKEMIKGYLKVLSSKPYVVGAHVWNLCDFKTAQGTHRPAGMNFKGVFTRDRQPKLAAHFLREKWKED